MSRIVVTGASGFLGRHVRDDLAAAGHEIVPVGRGPGGGLCNLDTGDSASIFDRIDAVVHLAGTLAQGPATPVSEYLGPNVALTEHVLLRGAEGGASRFVFSSSRLVYRSDLGHAATEQDTPAPETAYGLSKLFAEHVVAHQAARTGIHATSLRISQLVGPGDGNRGALARFAESARAGRAIAVEGRGAAVRDVVDVRDAARAVRTSLDALAVDVVPSALNIGGGGRTILELAEIACEAVGAPYSSIEHTAVDVDDESYWALDSTLAQTSVGWRAEIPLTDSIRHRWASEDGDSS